MSKRIWSCLIGAVILVPITIIAQGGNNNPPNPANFILSQPLASQNSQASQEELPGLGHKFELYGTAVDSVDPENLANHVVQIDTTAPGSFAVMLRDMGGPHVKANNLDHLLQSKYYLVNRTCGGGSPRYQLAIDTDGDGDRDRNVFGYFGPYPTFAGCPPNVWIFEDLTDDMPRWDLTQLTNPPIPPGMVTFPAPPGFVTTWDLAEGFMMGAFPNHQILTISMVDDSSWMPPLFKGIAYWDLSTMGNRTMEIDQDTVH